MESKVKEKIVIAGGSGALGQLLAGTFKDAEVVILSRTPKAAADQVSYLYWDGKTQGDWVAALEHSKVVINLTGKSVNCRYTPANKEEIIRSRVDATLAMGQAIQGLSHPPEVWINAGSAAIFGNSGWEIKNESSSLGNGFSPEVCKAWEHAFAQCPTPGTRKVFLRIGMVLQARAGVLKPFLNMARFGLGGSIGTGNQFMTWIHEADFVSLVKWVIEEKDIEGILHAASPNPVNNRDFMKALRKAVSIPVGLPNPALFIKLGAVLIGTEAELVLSGRRVVSAILEKRNFNFKYPYLSNALDQLVHNEYES
jgi:uncharacterized protein (TIGR01777 family)